MAPEALARRVAAALLACVVAMGCGRGAGDVDVAWEIEPTPPTAGQRTVVRVTLRHPDGRPEAGARLKIEAHMSHPGMAPVAGDAVEGANGAYEARLQLSMAGDWIFVVTGQLADGSRITRDTRVPGVRPAPGAAGAS